MYMYVSIVKTSSLFGEKLLYEGESDNHTTLVPFDDKVVQSGGRKLTKSKYRRTTTATKT